MSRIYPTDISGPYAVMEEWARILAPRARAGRYDYVELERRYIEGNVSLRALAREAGMSNSTISAHARAHNWQEKRAVQRGERSDGLWVGDGAAAWQLGQRCSFVLTGGFGSYSVEGTYDGRGLPVREIQIHEEPVLLTIYRSGKMIARGLGFWDVGMWGDRISGHFRSSDAWVISEASGFRYGGLEPELFGPEDMELLPARRPRKPHSLRSDLRHIWRRHIRHQ